VYGVPWCYALETFHFYIKAHICMKKRLVGLLLFLCGVGLAHSEITVKQYLAIKPVPTPMMMHVVGIGTGFSWANSHLEYVKQKLIYCEPVKLNLNADNYLSILDSEIARNEHDSGDPVAFILQKGLKRTFPCQ
jgi:hypothetical protein